MPQPIRPSPKDYSGGREMNDERVFAITMAYDAFRLCLGVNPKNHSHIDVIEWIVKMNEVTKKRPNVEKVAKKL